MGLLVTEGFSEESGLRSGRRDEEIPAEKSSKEKGLEYPRQNMLAYGGGGSIDRFLKTSMMVVERDDGDKRRATQI